MQEVRPGEPGRLTNTEREMDNEEDPGDEPEDGYETDAAGTFTG